MTRSSRIKAAFSVALLVLFAAGSAQAQVVQLPPPASYPLVISAPGSYELTGNLEPPSPEDAIDITSGDVTLNLNGFGINGKSGHGIGILGSSSANVRVINGSIGGFANAGIELGDFCTISKVQLLGDSAEGGSEGTLVCGVHSGISNVVVNHGGIVLGNGSRLMNSTAIGGFNTITSQTIPALICQKNCLVTESIFEQGAVKLGRSGFFDSFLGTGACLKK